MYSEVGTIRASGERIQPNDDVVRFNSASSQDGHATNCPTYRPFHTDRRSFVYGLQPRAIQGMLDFGFSCKRSCPSVAAMVYPFGRHHIQKFYWDTRETPTCVHITRRGCQEHPDVDVVVNFASSRSVYSTITLIAEGVPERQAREISVKAKAKAVLIIGPATVGGSKPGCFRIGNSGGMMVNVITSKLYRPGSVGYVSKSGGMSSYMCTVHHSVLSDGDPLSHRGIYSMYRCYATFYINRFAAIMHFHWLRNGISIMKSTVSMVNGNFSAYWSEQH
ncbi:hypothetical protein BU15DRAFT_64479 [Melanogaster broomeanus]|nr:hypothetical protein BU15DRAFT_64479 [Melanogaster broomeanus]